MVDAAGKSVLWPVIEASMALRGVSLLTETTIGFIWAIGQVLPQPAAQA